nr:light-harvesting complex-like protein 3 isotype 2, chloroplastic [Ipomoea batatas]
MVPARAVNDGSALASAAIAVELEKAQEKASEAPVGDGESNATHSNSNGSPAAMSLGMFQDPRWVGGTWDLKQFQIDGKTHWDALIDAVHSCLMALCFVEKNGIKRTRTKKEH